MDDSRKLTTSSTLDNTINTSTLSSNSFSEKDREREKSPKFTIQKPKKQPFFVTDFDKKIIGSISNNLQEIINENYSNMNQNFIKYDIFYAYHLPMISIEDYILRIYYYTKMDISTLIMAVIYIDIVCDVNKYVLCVKNIHRIIMASCLLSIKYNEDLCSGNDYYAKVGGLSLNLLNSMEYEFYVLMGFRLKVKDEYYFKYYSYFTRDR